MFILRKTKKIIHDSIKQLLEDVELLKVKVKYYTPQKNNVEQKYTYNIYFDDDIPEEIEGYSHRVEIADYIEKKNAFRRIIIINDENGNEISAFYNITGYKRTPIERNVEVN